MTRPSDAPQPTKSSQPRLPTPDYEHKPFAPQPPSTKTKPQPAPASHHAQAPLESKRYLPQVAVRQPSSSTHPSSSPDMNKKPSQIPTESKDNNIKLPPTPDMTSQMEEKMNALSKDFIQKVSKCVDVHCHIFRSICSPSFYIPLFDDNKSTVVCSLKRI